jgi:hypothetical protein
MALYDEILQITREYMGIVAESYLKIRCRISLDIDEPKDISRKDLEKFVDGIGSTAEVYMKSEKCREFTKELLKLRDRR